MHALVADKRDELAELCRRHAVIRLEVFGSAARGADFDQETSDVDFLVEFGIPRGQKTLEQYFAFADALRETLGRPVDLVEANAIRNPYFRAAIDRPRELVYSS